MYTNQYKSNVAYNFPYINASDSRIYPGIPQTGYECRYIPPLESEEYKMHKNRGVDKNGHPTMPREAYHCAAKGSNNCNNAGYASNSSISASLQEKYPHPCNYVPVPDVYTHGINNIIDAKIFM